MTLDPRFSPLAQLAAGCLVALMTTAACSSSGESSSTDVVAPSDSGVTADVTGDATLPDAPGGDVAPEPVAPSLVMKAAGEIRYDAQGVPHIRAASKTDALFLQGWATAHQRIFQMDYMRRQAYGTRAEVYGPEWVEDDKGKRVLGLKALAEANMAWYAAQHPAAHAEALSYVAGVNAWLAEAQAGEHPRPSEFDRVGADYWPPPWTAQDTLAISKLIVMANSFGADQEVLGAAATLLLGEETFNDLFRFQPMMPTYAIETEPGDESRFPKVESKADGSWRPAGSFATRFADLPAARRAELSGALVELAKRLASLRGTAIGAPWGSNSYAVDGAHAAGGKTLFCNEFHQPIVAPNRFMAVHMVIDGGDPMGFFGYALPGLPYNLGGHSGAVAFGITTSFGDVTDLYAEELDDAGDAVLFNGAWVPIERREEVIKVKPEGGDWKSPDEVTTTVEVVPHHGPIVNGLLPAELGALVTASGLVLSARWTGFDPETSPAAAISRLFDATTIDEAREALNLFDGGPMNWNIADANGDIGYTTQGPWPVRDWDLYEAPPWGPLDGTGGHEWARISPPSESVTDMRPAKGYHVDANGLMTAQNLDGDPLSGDRYLQHFADLGTRAWRLTEIIDARLKAGEKPTLEDAVSWQGDNLSIYSVELLPYLQGLSLDDVCPEPADVCDALTRLMTWDGHQNADSVEATLFNTWLTHVTHRILRQHLPGLAMGVIGGLMYSLGTKDVVAWAKGRAPAASIDWLDDPKTKDVTEGLEHHAAAALSEAVAQLRAHFGDAPMSTWTWESVHELRVDHIVFGDLGEGPYPMDGGPSTVNVSGYAGASGDGAVATFPLTATAGAIYRMCAELAGDATRGFHVLAGGQGGHVGQPHWMDQMATWRAHEVNATPLSPAQIEAATAEKLDFPEGYGAAPQ